MEEETLKMLWRDYGAKLDKSLALNKKLLEEVQKQKAQNELNSLKNFKIIMIILGLVWLLFLGFLIVNSLEVSKIFFVISVSLLFLVNVKAVAVYIQHVILINQINNTENVLEAQTKLAKLQSSTLQIVRLLFLQAPLYCTWFISIKWIKESPESFWLIQVPIVLLFSWMGIWLYRNIKIENKDKKWFSVLFSGKELNSVVKAKSYLAEIEKFEN